MKKLLLVLFVIPFIAFGQNENIIDYDDTIMMDGLKVMKTDSSLVNGKIEISLDTPHVFMSSKVSSNIFIVNLSAIYNPSSSWSA